MGCAGLAALRPGAAWRAACLSGRIVDRLGGVQTLRLWLGVQVAALALSLPPFAALVPPAALFAGFAAVGVTAVTLTVTREMAPERPAGVWVRCTASFAVAQAAVGFALAALFGATGESHVGRCSAPGSPFPRRRSAPASRCGRTRARRGRGPFRA